MSDNIMQPNLAQMAVTEKTRRQMGWTTDQFYAFPRLKRLPIYNVECAKDSMKAFEQTFGMSPDEEEKVKEKLLSVAGKLELDTSALIKPVKFIQLSDRSLVMKHAVLMSQGNWNKYYYSKAEIEKGIRNTDWNTRENSYIYLEHNDGGVGDWIGDVKNFSMEGDTLYGDLHIHNPIWATSLRNGKPHFGISPKVLGTLYKDEGNAVKDLLFKNFSLVLNPAVKTAYLNNSANLVMEDEEEVVSEERIQEIVEQEVKEIENTNLKEGEVKTMDKIEDMDDLFELYELKKLSIPAILRKARELKTDGEPFRDAVKRAAKLQEEEAGTPEVEPKEEKIEEPVPAEEDAPEAPAAEAEEKMREMAKEIKSLKEKFNEPAVKTLKKAEPVFNGDSDMGMMLYLKEEVLGE